MTLADAARGVIQLSDKINMLQSLPDIDNKDTVVKEIETLELFTDSERASIFGNSSILWVLKSYSIAELKDKALKSLNKPSISPGDVVKFGVLNCSGVVLEVTGITKDRLSIMYREESDYDSTYAFVEGVSIYDVKTTGESVDISFLEKLK